MGRLFRSDSPVPPASASPPLLRDLLRGHPRQALVSYLWSGFTLRYQGPVTPTWPPNLLSARSHRSAVTAAVALDVSRGHTTGIFVCLPFRLFHCSPSAPRRGPMAPCDWFGICPRLEEPWLIRHSLRGICGMVYLCGRGHCAQLGEEHICGESGHLPCLPPLPCAGCGLAAPALHVGRAGIRRPPAPFWGPLFPLFYSVCGGASLVCRTRSRVQARPPLPR